MINTTYSICNQHKISIAPMMDCTDKHFRMIMRQISSKALLYTEMIVAQSLIFSNNKEKLLDYNNEEHPISIQFGGDNPKFLSEVAKMAEDWGYDEINFNVGCPSSRVSSGNFGASLMNNPEQVGICIEALKNNCKIPVTIKHRIGVDNNDSFANLNTFVRKISNSGADRFIIHARKAFLKGLNPKENRTVPPLRYDFVEKLKKFNPSILIEINGGFTNIEQCKDALKIFDGVMIGRSAYKHPLRWNEIDEKFYEDLKIKKKASTVIFNLLPYIENHISSGGSSWEICKHLINVVESIPRAKKWRNKVTYDSIKGTLTMNKLNKYALELKEIGQ